MDINHLYNLLKEEILKGNGEVKVYFDTEARCFNYHLAEIKSIEVFGEEAGLENTCVLYES